MRSKYSVVAVAVDHCSIQCYEVAKTPRHTPATHKNKDRKGKAKGKENEKEQQQSARAMLYDYHDGSVHDIALRTHFERGYEEFKVGCTYRRIRCFTKLSLALAWHLQLHHVELGTTSP